MTAKKTTTRTRRTRKSKITKEETPHVEVEDTKPAEDPKEKEPQPSDENAKPPSRGRKLDATKVRDIRARLAKGEKAADIAAVYDLHPSSVDDIKVGRTWASVV